MNFIINYELYYKTVVRTYDHYFCFGRMVLKFIFSKSMADFIQSSQWLIIWKSPE